MEDIFESLKVEASKLSDELEKAVKESERSVAAHLPLPPRVVEVMLDMSKKAFEKYRDVAAMVRDVLMQRGAFYRTGDGRLFYFYRKDRHLLDLEQRAFQYLLMELSGLVSREAVFLFALDTLQAYAARKAPLVQVHTLAYYDPKRGLVVISDGGGEVWRRERGKTWQKGFNGDDEILFFTEPEAVCWTPDLTVKDDAGLKWFLGLFQFSGDLLSVEDQQTLLTVYLLHLFFPSLRRTKLIPAFLGPMGSGKTTACRLIGRLLIGPRFEVTGLRADREDAFVVALSNRLIHAVDNADSRVPWLDDALARYATGERYRLRQLYTTNEEASFDPTAILLIASRDPHFNRPDVAERLLPFTLARPEGFVDENTLFSELETRRPEIIGNLLHRIAETADYLDQEPKAPSLPFRIADFAAFGWRLYKALGQEDHWAAILKRIEAAQLRFAGQTDGLIQTLALLIEEKDSLGPLTTSDLFNHLRPLAEDNGYDLPKGSIGLGKKLTTHQRVIEGELGVKIISGSSGGKRTVTIKKLSQKPPSSPPSLPQVSNLGGDGGDGGDFSENLFKGRSADESL